jgi:N-methylhydantoinase B
MTLSIDRQDIEVFRARESSSDSAPRVDPITTEIIRHGLNSAANQMKRVLMRTAFSPIIYEILDFAVAIYDRDIRMLAQAPSLPTFMGTMSFCVDAAVTGVGGEDELEDGDILFYNWPYGTGSHANDSAVVMPIFLRRNELVGYAAIKAHLLDIGQKETYSTDTVDIQQEGTFFPGVKLYRRGKLNDDVHRIAIANSRLPKQLAGDLAADVAGVRTGAAAVVRLVERNGLATFQDAVERMYDHGEAVVRSYLEKLPDGEYTGQGQLDNDGLSEGPIPFEITVEIDGTTCRVDFSKAPEACAGPLNCPVASTVSASRVALALLAGGGEQPNEGHFRPLEVIARKGSLFYPLPPSPCFLYSFPTLQTLEVIFEAFGKAMPEAAPAWSGGDPCAVVWWGTRERTGEAWGAGSPYPIGHGAHHRGDGPSGLNHISGTASRFPPTEVVESKFPVIMQKLELATDSCGAGTNRGGLALDLVFEHTEDCHAAALVERTRSQPWGLEGGQPGRVQSLLLTRPNGTTQWLAKDTAVFVEKGATMELRTGGGGGWGPPLERDPEAVRQDLREGYISEEHAREHYPHAAA